MHDEVIVVCEESQAVTIELRKRNIKARSCDILPCSGGHPEWHIQDDARNVLKHVKRGLIAFPPCTDLANSGARHFEAKRADGRQEAAIRFFKLFLDHPCKRKLIENPVGIMNTGEYIAKWFPELHAEIEFKKPLIVHPWQFGHKEMKPTCLWLTGLPDLRPTKMVGPPPKPLTMADRRIWQKIHRASPGVMRSIIRSKTYPGIAAAMAEQWASYFK